VCALTARASGHRYFLATAPARAALAPPFTQEHYAVCEGTRVCRAAAPRRANCAALPRRLALALGYGMCALVNRSCVSWSAPRAAQRAWRRRAQGSAISTVNHTQAWACACARCRLQASRQRRRARRSLYRTSSDGFAPSNTQLVCRRRARVPARAPKRARCGRTCLLALARLV
jgi:hypothetical protein